MNPPRATLGGVPLADAASVTWLQTSGTGAPTQTFVVHESRWEAMKALLGQPVTLRVTSDSARVFWWSQLYPLREVPTSKPMHRAVLVSDVRWKWAREIVVRSYNVPRKTGNRRLVEGAPIEIQIDYDLYAYAYTSLKADGGTRRKWLARDCIEDIVGEIADKCGHAYRIDGLAIKDTPALAVEYVELAESADHALTRVLRQIPQSLITIDREGTAVVFDGTDREKSEEIMSSAGKPTEVGRIDRLVDLEPIRPRKIHVYFAKEVELRFDASEESDDVTVTVPADTDSTMTGMENVLPLPDPYTEIDGERIAQGTIVPVRKAIQAWNKDLAAIGKPISPPALTFANIRRLWFQLDAVYAPLGKCLLSAAEANWVSRISTLKRHYRQTYQIPHPWMRHIRDLRPFRLGAVANNTTSRAPSQAWSQYCIVPTAKAYAIASLQKDPDLQFYWLNVDNYPGADKEVWDKPAAPATVQVLDKEMGVLHIDYATGRYGMRAEIHPSMMKEDGSGKVQAASRDLREQLHEVMAIDGRCRSATLPHLAEDFRVAIIVTAMPFAPNDEGRFFRLTVDPSSIRGYLADHFQVEGGSGPDWHIAIPPSLATAWYGLRSTVDGRDGAKILFGFDEADSGSRNNVPGYEILNYGETPGPAILHAMAHAVAVAQWAAFVSQREGSRTVHLNPGVEMAGSIEGIKHTLSPDGRLTTEISMPTSRRPLDPLSLLPAHTRPWILGTIFDANQ